jgi:hypothetical protein
MGSNEREERAERTALRILDEHPAMPLQIPGALDVRVVGPRRIDTMGAGILVAPAPQPAHDARYARERNEYEVEGGGAAGERQADRPSTLLARLRRAFSRRADAPGTRS